MSSATARAMIRSGPSPAAGSRLTEMLAVRRGVVRCTGSILSEIPSRSRLDHDPPLPPVFSPIPPMSTSSPSRSQSSPAGRSTQRLRPFGRAGARRAAVGLLRGPADRQRQARASTTSGHGSTRTCSAGSHHAGLSVDRRAGWDTHGLPVEVEVEKALGIPGKRQIEEEVGIAEFIRLLPRVGAARMSTTGGPTHRPDRLLGRPRPRLLDARPRLHRVGLVAPPAALRSGPALRGHQGRPRTAPGAGPASRATSSASPTSTGTRRTSRPMSACRWSIPTPASLGRGHGAARVDDHAVDASVQHRGGRPPRAHLRGGRRAGRGRGRWSRR